MSLEERLAIQEFETLASGIILRGYYKPGGDSGASLRQIMAKSRPALYPYVGDPDRVDVGALACAKWLVAQLNRVNECILEHLFPSSALSPVRNVRSRSLTPPICVHYNG